MKRFIVRKGIKMTNYEKYKEEIINMLVDENTCLKIAKLHYGKLKCNKQKYGVRIVG